MMGLWPTLAPPRPRLPHGSRCSNRGHHGRWHHRICLSSSGLSSHCLTYSGLTSWAMLCPHSGALVGVTSAAHLHHQVKVQSNGQRSRGQPGHFLRRLQPFFFPHPSTPKIPVPCDEQPLLRISKRANSLHARRLSQPVLPWQPHCHPEQSEGSLHSLAAPSQSARVRT